MLFHSDVTPKSFERFTIAKCVFELIYIKRNIQNVIGNEIIFFHKNIWIVVKVCLYEIVIWQYFNCCPTNERTKLET